MDSQLFSDLEKKPIFDLMHKKEVLFTNMFLVPTELLKLINWLEFQTEDF
jgi:hypothetical protein